MSGCGPRAQRRREYTAARRRNGSSLSADASSETVPIKIDSNVRGSPTPALNALAAARLAGTALALVLAVVALKVFRRGQRGSSIEDFARLEL